MKQSVVLLISAVLLLCRAVVFAEPPTGFQNEIVVVGLDMPTCIEFLPDGRLLVGEKENHIFVVQPNAGVPNAARFLDLGASGLSGGQGLMDIELDPDFDVNGFYYVFYTKGSLTRNRVSRFTASGNSTVAGSELVLWQDIQSAMDEHQGGTVVFGPDGKLYITVGEAFVPDDAQKLTSYRGKILRINRDGTVPTDNPFHDGNGPQLDAIWAYGLRNPFRGSFDSLTGQMFIGEVGSNDPAEAIEEINLGVRGANYGWPLCEGACGTIGFTSPIFSYPHAGRDAGVIGGFVYRGSQFPNAYQGSYFFADYAQNWIRRLTFNTNGTVAGVANFEPADGTPDGDYGDPTCLKQGPDGAIYYTDFNHDPDNFWAMVRRIRYTGANLPPIALASATNTAGVPPLTVNFRSTGSLDPEGQPITFLWNFGDGQTATAANPSHAYTQAGMFTVRLSVSDGTNTTLSNPLTIVVGNAPKVIIQTPTNGTVFRAGNVIPFIGSATDTEDGLLPPAALNWNVIFHHGAHIHPVSGPWTATNRSQLVIPASGHPFGHDTSYQLMLIATDSSGLQSAASVTVVPDLVDITVDSSPSGLTVEFDGISRSTPFTDGSVIGFQHNLSAPNQSLGASNFLFQAWSDGGAQAHSFTVPANNLLLRADYRGIGPGQSLIESFTRLTNGFQIRFTTEAGRTYFLERSPNMLSGSWTNLGAYTGTGLSVSVVDLFPGIIPQSFYRIRLSPEGSFGSPAVAAAAEAHQLNASLLQTSLVSSGQNRALLVGLCWNDLNDDSVLSVTYNGQPCQHLATTNWFYGSGGVAFYGLTAPPAGNYLLNVTMTGPVTEFAMAGVIFTNANQIGSFGAPVAEFLQNDAAAIAVSVPSAATDLVADLLGYYAFDPTPGAGQIERISAINLGNASLRLSTKAATAGSTTMSWGMSDTTQISQLGIAIKSR